MCKIISLLLLVLSLQVYGELKVFSDFEGASAKNIKISGNVVEFQPGGTGNRGFTCWWYVKLENINTSEPLVVTVDASKLVQSKNRSISFVWALPDSMSFSFDQKQRVHSEKGKKIYIDMDSKTSRKKHSLDCLRASISSVTFY